MKLRDRVRSGLFWTGGVRLISQILTWAITLVVIRLLAPEDYGLLAMATVFVGLLTLMSEAGLGSALVQTKELDDQKLRGIFAAVIIVNVALFAAQYALAPLIASFFNEVRLVAVIRVLAIQFLLSIFTTIPTALLTRALNFKRLSLVSLAGTVCGSLATLALAATGHGVWALIAGSLVSQVCSVLGLNLLATFLRWPDFSLNGVRGLIGFGGQVTATRMLWAAYSQADIFIGGKLLGKEQLGFYSVAMDLASLPVQKMMSVVNQVAFPAFSQIRDDPARVTGALLKMVRLASLVGFPVMWGFSSVAPEVVNVLLGSKWQQVATPLQLIALIMPLRMLSALLPPMTDGIGRADVALLNLSISALVMPLAFLIGCQWGLVGLATAWLVSYPLIVLQNIFQSVRVIGLSVRRFLGAAARPTLAAAMVYASVSLLRPTLPVELAEWIRLCLLVSCGGFVYAVSSWLMNRDGVMELHDLVRR